MRAWLFLIALGCSTTTPSSTQKPAVAAAECATDVDCAIAEFADPATSGGCCEAMCDRPLVTAREAERRRLAWEASCAAVRCANPGCPEDERPDPVCRAGKCELGH